jgi:hypothetical protein
MGLEPLAQQEAREFRGLITNADPRDIGVGASQDQTNMQCLVNGQIQCRGGNRPVTFSNGITSVAGQIIGMCFFQTPNDAIVVFQNEKGEIRVGKNAA